MPRKLKVPEEVKIDVEFCKWVFDIFDKYKRILYVEHFIFSMVQDTSVEYAAMSLGYPYLSAKFRFNTKVVTDWQNGYKPHVERVIVHELCHVLTDPLYCKAISRFIDKESVEDERERLTDHFTNVVYNLVNPELTKLRVRKGNKGE